MTFRTHLLMWTCATLLFSATVGCGGPSGRQRDAGGPDSGNADQALSGSCEVDNGGCSISPMVLCGTGPNGAVLCAACPAGYTGDGRVCTSVAAQDECALETDNCSPNAICTDTPGAFVCTCAIGFAGDGVTCVHQGCTSAAQCDDGVACTVDTCGASGSCLHAPSAELCAADAICHPTAGCMTGRICGSPADCVDTDPCTRNETCNTVTATCTFTLLDNDHDGEIPLVCGGTDCNDATSAVGAGAPELCGNDRDDDCNGVIDTDATLASDPLVLLNSEQNCGACGNVCGLGQTCYLGACVPCGDSVGATCCGTECSSLTSCTGGTCTNGGTCAISGAVATCTAPCGGVGESCCPGDTCRNFMVCSDGSCLDPSTCSDAGAAVLYRLGTLDIPTPAQASAGAVVGHNLDSAGSTCAVPDYAGGVDNSLIDLADALPWLSPDDPIDLQGEIDNALACPSTGPTCSRLDLIVRVRSGTGCTVFEVLDGLSVGAATVAGPAVGTLDASGHFRVQFPSFNLTIPFDTGAGFADLNFSLSTAILSGTVSSNSLLDVVLGGVLVKADFEQTIMDVLALLGDEIPFEAVAPILANLYDVQIGGMCSGLSTGFLASGSRVQ